MNNFKKLTGKIETVTIAIPAYNEGKNISNILYSVLSQHKTCFQLLEIFVANDGSTDNTVRIVEDIAKTYPIIKLLNDGKRKGKTFRLNQLLKESDGDIIVTLDADIILKDKNALNNLLIHFQDKNIGLVAGHKIPNKPKGFMERIIVGSYMLFFMIRKDVNGGDSVFNMTAAFFAIRKKFIKRLRIPNGLYSISEYLYFSILRRNGKFGFAKNAHALYKAPSNFSDFLMQANRASPVDEKLFSNFRFKGYYNIPFKNKLFGTIEMFKKDPLYCVLCILFLEYVKATSREKIYIQDGTWQTVNSTKVNMSIL